jgi:hypothetical protein
VHKQDTCTLYNGKDGRGRADAARVKADILFLVLGSAGKVLQLRNGLSLDNPVAPNGTLAVVLAKKPLFPWPDILDLRISMHPAGLVSTNVLEDGNGQAQSNARVGRVLQ